MENKIEDIQKKIAENMEDLVCKLHTKDISCEKYRKDLLKIYDWELAIERFSFEVRPTKDLEKMCDDLWSMIEDYKTKVKGLEYLVHSHQCESKNYLRKIAVMQELLKKNGIKYDE